jgi:hypothetical protein
MEAGLGLPGGARLSRAAHGREPVLATGGQAVDRALESGEF